jgi:hypothetical protein
MLQRLLQYFVPARASGGSGSPQWPHERGTAVRASSLQRLLASYSASCAHASLQHVRPAGTVCGISTPHCRQWLICSSLCRSQLADFWAAFRHAVLQYF